MKSITTLNIVIIKGSQGEGKTTTALQVMKIIRDGKRKKQPILIYHPHQWHQAININDQVIVLIDDMFGKYKFNDDWISLLGKSMIETIRKGNVSVIITSRTNIFEEAKKYLKIHVTDTFTNEISLLSDSVVVDLSKQYPLTPDEKRKMLSNIFETNQISPRAGEIKAILEQEPNPLFGFPLICKLYIRNTHKKGERDIRFFTAPSTILMDEISKLRVFNPNHYFALIFCSLQQNQVITKSDLNPFKMSSFRNYIPCVAEACNLHNDNPKVVLREALKTMSGFYIKETNSKYEISQTSVSETLDVIIRQEHPEIELERRREE